MSEMQVLNPIPTGLGHVTLKYGLIMPMAGRNRVKVVILLKKMCHVTSVRPRIFEYLSLIGQGSNHWSLMLDWPSVLYPKLYEPNFSRVCVHKRKPQEQRIRCMVFKIQL